MILKSRPDKARRQKEPVEVNLTVRVNFGDTPESAVTVIDDQRIPMVDSVFAYREKIMRGMVFTLLKVGVTTAAVTREIFPIIRLLNRR